MLITLVQHKHNSASAGSATLTVTVTGVTAGSLLVVGAATSSPGGGVNTTVSSITDNGGTPNTYVQTPSAQAADLTRGLTDVWSAKNALSGATTVTVTFSQTGGEKNIWVWEVSGMDTSSPVDLAVGLNTVTSSASPVGAAVTTTNANDFVVGIILPDAQAITVNPKAGNEFTAGGDITAVSEGAGASLIAASATTHTPQWDAAGLTSGVASTAAFKGAGAGPSFIAAPPHIIRQAVTRAGTY